MRSLVLFPFFFLGFAQLFAQDTQDLSDLLAAKAVEITVVGMGGHTGQSLEITFQNQSQNVLRVRVPAGFVFEPSDTAAQSLVVVKSELVILRKKAATRAIYALCVEANDRSPMKDAHFSPVGFAGEQVRKMANWISERKLYDHEEAQEAIWCMSDGHSVAGLRNALIQTAACQFLGIPRPKYQVETAKGRRVQPGERASAYKPLAVRGKMKYSSRDRIKLSLYVVDATGTRVKTIFENREHPAGIVELSFFFQTYDLPRGKYQVQLLNNEEVMNRMEVEY